LKVKGKSGSGRSIVCFRKELFALKEFSKILLGLSIEKINIAIENGDFIEVRS